MMSCNKNLCVSGQKKSGIFNIFCSEEIAVGRTPFGCVKSALQNGFDVDEVAKELMVSTEYVQEVKDYLDYESLKG